MALSLSRGRASNCQVRREQAKRPGKAWGVAGVRKAGASGFSVTGEDPPTENGQPGDGIHISALHIYFSALKVSVLVHR